MSSLAENQSIQNSVSESNEAESRKEQKRNTQELKQLPECKDGVCTLNWKPVARSAA